jgi:hypothetical protein
VITAVMTVPMRSAVPNEGQATWASTELAAGATRRQPKAMRALLRGPRTTGTVLIPRRASSFRSARSYGCYAPRPLSTPAVDRDRGYRSRSSVACACG